MAESPPTDLIIVWIGRFGHRGGYGVATRDLFRALRESGYQIIGVDSQFCQPIDDFGSSLVDVEKTKDHLVITSRSDAHRIVAFFHETPPHWKRVTVKGQTHVAGYTVSETEQIPFGWMSPMLSVDQVFTATGFNKDIFIAGGMPKTAVSVLPHAIDTDMFYPRKEKVSFPGANEFCFLSIVSNLNRKDLGGLVRTYASAFSPSDDVSLIIKLPPNMSDKDIKTFIFDAAMPWVDLYSSNVPHIVLLPDLLTDEKLIELYASCHAYVSLERGKGWDLPSLEAMLMGLPCLNIAWGGNLEFQTPENSVQIPPLDKSVYANDENVKNWELYVGHTWAGVDYVEAAKGLRRLYTSYKDEVEKTVAARSELQGLVSTANVVGVIDDYIARLETHDFKSNDKAVVVLKTDTPSKIAAPARRTVAFEKLEVAEKEVINQTYQPGEDPQEWTTRRRKIWGRYGAVLPRLERRQALMGLRNKYLGESIFILGNGPSLNKIDLDRLSGYHTFAANRIYLLFDRTTWRPDFYTTLDWRVTPDNFDDINQLSDMTFFFPHRFDGMLRDGPGVYWYESSPAGPFLYDRFETNIENGVRGAGTVLTAAIQIAYYLGFRKIFLSGVDATYRIPETVKQSGGDRFGTGVQINLESTKDDDINHFDPRYFGKGSKWHDPNVDEMKRGFKMCYRAIDHLGGEFYNATVGGALDCVPRMDFEEALNYADKKT